MSWTAAFFSWLNDIPLLTLAGFLAGSVILACGLGYALRTIQERDTETIAEAIKHQTAETCIVSGLLGLLALLLAFTFSLAIDRFEVRRQLVITHANAIGTAYLRAQILPEPHRAKLSALLADYTRNALALARARAEDIPPLIAHDDRVLKELWASTIQAHQAVQAAPFSINLLVPVNALIDNDASRRAERSARLPSRVFAALFLYLVATGAVFGFVLSGTRTRLVACLLLALLVISLLLIMDIDQPTRGLIVESQEPMEAVLDSILQNPPGSYDR